MIENGAWKASLLGDLVAIDKGRIVQTQPFPIKDAVPYIGADAFGGSYSQFTNDPTAVLCEQTDVLMLWDGERSGLCTSGLRGAVSSTVARLRPKSGISSRFLYHQLSRQFSWIQARRTGTGVPHVPKDIASMLTLPIPASGREQVRIAAVLDKVDEAIAKTELVIAKLQILRAGLLSDLLSLGLDQYRRLRDPINRPEQFQESRLGRIPREWRIGSVNDLSQNQDARRIPLKQGDRDKRHGQYPYYGASGIIDYIDDYLFDGEFVLLAEDGENLRSRELPLAIIAKGKFWVNNHAHILQPVEGADIRLLCAILEGQNYIPWLAGSAQPKLTQAGLHAICLKIPPFQEQAQIADLLELFDAKVAAEENLLRKILQLKSGLAAELLTGRVRVPESIFAIEVPV